MPDEKAILIALHEYTASVRTLARVYADDMTQIQLRHASECRNRENDFEAAIRDHREKLTRRLGLESDA